MPPLIDLTGRRCPAFDGPTDQCDVCAVLAGWQPPTEPTAERAGDADDVATVLAVKFCDVIQTWEHHDQTDDHPCSRCQRYARVAADWLAAQPAAVPDRAEVDALRAAVEAFCETLESEDDYVRSWKCARQLRAVLGDQADRIEETP